MDTSTNHLVSRERLEAMTADERRKYTPVPPELQGAAHRKLKGRQEAFVARHSGGRLANWAAKQRAAAKRAAKSDRRRKMAKATRKKQRRRG